MVCKKTRESVFLGPPSTVLTVRNIVSYFDFVSVFLLLGLHLGPSDPPRVSESVG